MADCGCGRSPTGKCVGWHDLTEEQYQEKKAAYEAKKAEKEVCLVRLIGLVLLASPPLIPNTQVVVCLTCIT